MALSKEKFVVRRRVNGRIFSIGGWSRRKSRCLYPDVVMNLPVCLSCGARKFGPWLDCPVCGFRPTNPVERAKSMFLSEQYLDAVSLGTASSLIRHRAEPQFDSLSLVTLTTEIEDRDYYWQQVKHGKLPCRNCGQNFAPESRETVCARCQESTSKLLRVCSPCKICFGESNRFCSKCGLELRHQQKVSPVSFGRDVAMLVHTMIMGTDKVWIENGFVRKLFDQFSTDAKRQAGFEQETFVLYEAILVLRDIISSADLVNSMVLDGMLKIYKASWVLQGMAETEADGLVLKCGKRFDEYDRITTQFGGSIETLAHAAFEKTFGRKMEENLGVVVEWVGTMGLFHRNLENYVSDRLLRSGDTPAGDDRP